MQLFEHLRQKALQYDEEDSLKDFRTQFFMPENSSENALIYFCGNSLGLQPKNVRAYVLQEIEDWRKLGVEGHFRAKKPWLTYHEEVSSLMADIVGAKQSEVVVMNSLTVNLHLLMVSFYRPTRERYKIIIEENAFPSDRYAVESQLRFHGFDPKDALLVLPVSNGISYSNSEDIRKFIKNNGAETALILIGGVNYYSGQLFPLENIVEWGHEYGCKVGFDLAHAAGNVICDLHRIGADFAAWCTYKYMNAGPGGLSGIFVHDRFKQDSNIPRFAGWWGHNKETRFHMPNQFDPLPGAEGWQLSNPPILQMAALHASLELFKKAGIHALRKKSIELSLFLEDCIRSLETDKLQIITPSVPESRGCQLSIRVEGGKDVFERLSRSGIIADWREPDVIRVAPVPFYNTFWECWEFTRRLEAIL